MIRLIVLASFAWSVMSFQVAYSQPISADQINALRGEMLNQESAPPPLFEARNDDKRRLRNYPMQPPVIPHSVRGYQVDLYANKCLSCHARTKIVSSQAPMISVTHFMDRDGNFLAEVSPRRYFCNQCHVPQMDVEVLPVENDYRPIDEILDMLVGEK